jgi:phenol 2-monooxygenase
VAQELIELDKALAEIYTGKSLASAEEVVSTYDRNRKHGNGDVCYAPGLLVAAAEMCEPGRASGLRLGQRIPDADIINHASGCIGSVHATLKSNGRWRMLIFPGDLASEDRIQQVNSAGDKIASILRTLPPGLENATTPKPIEVMLIHAGNPGHLEASRLHRAYYPFNETSGYDYNTIFAASPVGGVKLCSVYEAFGISEDSGAVVVVRPDQVVAWIGDLTDLDRLRAWLHVFMVFRS